MRGALEAGGTAACVLADGLERASTRREHRTPLMDGRLVLICPYDPAAGFLVGHAMQRNKLIYALADAALVVSAEFEKGGTWAGAVEQLDRHRFVSVYVRAAGEMGKGLDALLERGARRWLDPEGPEALGSLLDTPPAATPARGLASLLREVSDGDPADDAQPARTATPTPVAGPSFGDGSGPDEKLLARVRELLLPYLTVSRTEAEVAEGLAVRRHQARSWLKRLVADGAVERLSKPVRYRAAGAARSTPLFPASGSGVR